MSATTSTAADGSSAQKELQQHNFEFTKRKRWADLLIAELAEAIILILSSSRKVLFCSAAAYELLGWRDEEFIDIDLCDFMNGEDSERFKGSFNDCLQTRDELLAYARMRYKTRVIAGTELPLGPKEALFELKGYPHFMPGQNECKCFFIMAKPYPSRNNAMMNTFLELKMENERLQQRVLDLKARSVQSDSKPLPPSASSSSANPYPSTSHMQMLGENPPLLVESNQTSNPHYYSGRYGDLGGHTSIRGSYDSGSRGGFVPYGGLQSFGGGGIGSTIAGNEPGPEDFDEDGLRRKKPKKTHPSDQYVCVTCGRTDSPEWRKGPLGPKTLCNACGLRWAKQMRKSDDGADGTGGDLATS